MKPEEKLSRDVRSLIEIVGGRIFSTEQGYRRERGGTRVSRGIPDLMVFVKTHFTFVELKVGNRKLNPAQEHFQRYCQKTGTACQVWRSVFDCKGWLMEIGVVDDDRGTTPPEAA